MKFTFNVDSEEFDALLIQRLQDTYIDHVTNWMFEPDAEKIAEALLTTISLFMVHSEYEEWYETIKDI